MFRLIFFLSTIGLICMGCYVRQKTSAKNQEIVEELNIKPRESLAQQIFFLTFSLTQDTTNDKYNIRLTDSRLVNGQLKPGNKQEGMVIEPGYLYVECLDRSNDRTDWIKVQDPLTAPVEYVETDGTLRKKIINKTAGQLLLRFQYNDRTSFISIFRPIKSALTLKKIYHAKL